ncbi:3-oxoacyl-ACP synthase [Maribacter halichondriae]|uniref:3-oxoacyl-ACP synthase n=1 Tax=Maribacter halichondriae TaxID=2980554 RepID=UPI00235A20ED|nr:3-oxoacyl-ACP synthase [Maribacter sp. Hal144]
MTTQVLKKSLFQFCHTYVEQRIARINSQIIELQHSLSSETKSSAGDKHETGRAMIQLEREKLGKQLFEAEKMFGILNKINIDEPTNSIRLGSLVYTSKQNYFLSISAGEFRDIKTSVFCISTGTPMAQMLLGKSVGEVAYFNGEEIYIDEIV